jgi:RNA polymerase sigma-70 factor, ECF subfamily
LANTTELAGLRPDLLRDLLPRLWAFAWRITGDRLDAEELTQKTCLRARQRVEVTPDGVQPLCRLYAIAYRVWIDELRAQRSSKRIDSSAPAPQREDDDAHLRQPRQPRPPRASDSEHDAFSQIVAAVDQLPHAQRMAMLLVAVEALSYAEAAHVLGVPVNTVVSRVVRAREAIGRQRTASQERTRA